VWQDASSVGTHNHRSNIQLPDTIKCFPTYLRSAGYFCTNNSKTDYNFKPPATDEEIRASAIQFVRKLSGFNRPSQANEAAFNRAVDAVTEAAHDLLASLVTTAPPRDRAVEAAKARTRSAARYR